MKTYVYKTTDFGKTWTQLTSPAFKGFAHVIREDVVNSKLLWVGTENGLFISIDGGDKLDNSTARSRACRCGTFLSIRARTT